MNARPAADPVPAPVARAGSRRPGPLLVLAAGVLAAGLVRGLLLESYHVPSAAHAPTFEPGDRVLVLKTDHHGETGDFALADDDGALRVVPSGELAGGSDVVGTILWRFWPLDRLGPVTATTAGASS